MNYTSFDWKKYLKYSAAVKNRSLLLKYVWINLWERKKDMIYWISYYNQNEYLICKKWAKTDLSSVPCFLECYLPKQKYVIAVVHDEWYTKWDKFIFVKDKNRLSCKFRELQKHWKWIDDNKFLPNKKFWDLLYLYWMLEENNVFYWWRWNIISYIAYYVLIFFWKIKYKKK